MSRLNRQSKAIGLDISDLTIRAIQLSGHEGNAEIVGLAERDIDSGLIHDGEIRSASEFATQIKELIGHPQIGKFSSTDIVASLPESKSFLKVIDVPIVTDNERAAAISAAAAQHVPYSSNELVMDWQRLPHHPSSGESQTYLVGAIPREIVASYQTAIEEAGFRPVTLEIESAAIVRSLFSERQSPTAATIVLDIGLDRTTMIVYDYGTIELTSSERTIGGRGMTELIAKNLRLTWDEAEDAKRYCGLDPDRGKGVVRDALLPSIETIVTSIQRTTDYYRSQFVHSRPIESIIIVGGGANLRHLTSVLAERLQVATSLGNPRIKLNQKKSLIKAERLLSYPTVIGLGLRGLSPTI